MSYLTKLMPSSLVLTLAVWGALWATMPVETAFAKATDPSTYQDSCSTIEVVGTTLRAVCRRRDGSFNTTSTIQIRGIDNANGKLAYARHPAARSTYQDSCENIDAIGATLMARCRKRDGSFNEKTTIQIRGIDNANGKLAYAP